jgi:hypothetical protein
MNPNLPTSPRTPRESADAIVDRLFARLTTMYGKHWLDLWVGVPMEAVKAEWSRALTGVSVEQVRLALDSMLDKGNAFPPTMPEFVSLCRAFRRTEAPHLSLADKRRGDGPPGGFNTLRSILRKAGAPQE